MPEDTPVQKSKQRSTISFSSALGALPYFLFITFFLAIPIISNLIVAFKGPDGSVSLETMAEGIGSAYWPAFLLTLGLSAVTAIGGGILGLILAWAISANTSSSWINGLTKSFAALAAQSGGVQLAYAFVALLGTGGLLTTFLERIIPAFGDIFSLTGFWGVALVYMYFQVPLMAVLMLPAMTALKPDWKDAAISLGASNTRYVFDVAIPVLWPSILGSLLLLFANSFAAYATAYALAGGSLNLIPIIIGFLISGNVLLNPGLAAALVTWMMIIICAAMGLRLLLSRRSDQWLRA